MSSQRIDVPPVPNSHGRWHRASVLGVILGCQLMIVLDTSIVTTALPHVQHELLPIHSRDTKDDILLSCALGGNCDYLITGDEDLLVLNGKKELGELQIIKVADFLKRKGEK